MNIITRFAPSPTGFLHVGSVRSALFNYLFARQNGGKIILRIEDTDKERNKPEYIDAIYEGFKWLNIDFDETYKQSDNFSIHRKYLESLIAQKKAYISKEEVKEEGQRSEVIRFRNPNKKVTVNDIIKGPVTFDTTELGDFIIAKSLDEPIFHFSNVIDDIGSKITHVIRGEEHLSNTPRQILIWEAIGEVPLPVYAHIPLILSEKREKISKRKHGEMVSVEFYRKNGYLPEALLNFLALLGWNPGTDQEILSIGDMIEKFRLEKVQKGGAIFNVEKLKWFNKQYLDLLDTDDFLSKAEPYLPSWLKNNKEKTARILPLLRDKIHYFGEIQDLFLQKGELAFTDTAANYENKQLLWKNEANALTTLQYLLSISAILSGIEETHFDEEAVKKAVWPLAEEKGKGNVLWPMRMALTGQEKSPDPFVCASILGKEESLKRIGNAIEKLKNAK